jgi:hypothetical protein
MTVPDGGLLPQIKGILGNAGVPYFVKNEGLQSLMGWGTIGLGYNNVFGAPVVMVAPDELDTARALLKDFGMPVSSNPGRGAARAGAAIPQPSQCRHCRNELKAEEGDEPLTHCYHCGWPLDA